MDVTIEQSEPIENAFDRLRGAPLEVTNGEQIFVYREATMRLTNFLPEELNPTSFYVLKNHLDMINGLRECLLEKYQVDILQLSSILHIRTEDGRLIGMAPPVVEIYEETVQIIHKDGDNIPPNLSLKIPILKDGIHRAWIARESNVTISCIVIHNSLKNYLPYAYPNTWSQVDIYESKPEVKKLYRRKNPYTYMRPLRVLRQVGNTPSLVEWAR